LAAIFPWPNSTLLRGELADVVPRLKEQSNGILAIMGSGELIASLMATDVIDEYLLMIHPLVLGRGRRIFPEEVDVSLRLTGSTSSSAAW
jgi:dihydrofolate reductase